MRTSGLLPVVYLSNVGQTLSFPGIRQLQPTLPEPTLPPVPLTDDKVIYLRKKHNGEVVLPADQLVDTVVEEKKAKEQQQQYQQLQERRKAVFAVYLAAVAGALDVICFQKFGCFAHLMTGNTVKCFAAVTEWKWAEAMFYATMVAFYTAGAAGYRMVDIFNEKRGGKIGKGNEASTLKLLSTILLPIFALSEGIVRLLQLPTATGAFLWAFGNGIVNASTLNTMGIVTNAVTGHWNKLGIASMDRLLLGEKKDAIKVTYKVLAATAVSVIGTGLFTKFVGHRFTHSGLLSPSGLLIGFIYFAIFRWYGHGPILQD